MRFHLILPESEPLLRPPAPEVIGFPREADEAAAQLRADHERLSRWVVGVVAYLLCVGGIVFCSGAIHVVAVRGQVHAVELVFTAIGLGVAGLPLAVLVKLWRSGRALTSAAAAWLRLPYQRGQRSPQWTGWLEARLVNFEPRVLLRIASASCLFLAALFGIFGAGYSFTEGEFAAAVMFLLIGLLSLACGLSLSSGIMRLVLALSVRDPMWVRFWAR